MKITQLVLKLADFVRFGAALPFDARARRLLDAYQEELRQSRPQVPFLLPSIRMDQAFPWVSDLTLSFSSAQIQRLDSMTLPLAELLCLSAICRAIRPRSLFEIGTYTGSATLAMALNSPDDATIYTLDLPQSQRDSDGYAQFEVGSNFVGLPLAGRIHQLWGESTSFDYAPYRGRMDLVLIDGNHEYEHVRSDSEKAFEVLAPGGVILWDDYLWDPRYPECAGVTRCLNELKETRACFLIQGTRLALFMDRPRRG